MEKKAKPTVPEVLPLVQALYRTERGACGCCLHVVLDDGNVHDDFVAAALRRAEEAGHQDCRALAALLLRMSKTQRLKLSNRAYY